jgi:hypothetical protein
MQSTIHKPLQKANPIRVAGETEVTAGDEVSDLAAEKPIDPADGLKWLDDNLPPKLQSIEHRNFLIADTFDITSAFLLDILQDTDEGARVSNTSVTTGNLKTMQMDSGSGKGKAVPHQPQDDEWSTF